MSRDRRKRFNGAFSDKLVRVGLLKQQTPGPYAQGCLQEIILDLVENALLGRFIFGRKQILKLFE